MRPLKELSDINLFFYYGQLDLDIETESDVVSGLVQPKKSLFYDRSEGCGVSEYENYPSTLLLEIMLRFDIAKYVYWRNTIVGDGTDGTKERRVALSQWSIITERNRGNVNLQVNYIPYIDLQSYKPINLPVGVRS